MTATGASLPVEPSVGRRASAWAWPVLAAAGSAEVVASWFMAQHSLLGARWSFLLPLALWVPLWLVAGWASHRIGTSKVALGLILFLAMAMRLAAASGTTPSISSDLYRYGWDAHVQLSGHDPYLYPPKAPQLRSLRTEPWFPDPAGCAHVGDRPGCTLIGRASVRTIYPAAAEGWFDLVELVYPGRAGSRAYQLAGGLVDDATIVLLAVALGRLGRDRRGAAWYALSPIPVIEFAGNGHVDGLALLLLVASVLALQRGRRGLAGVLIGLATMVKLYPAIALVAAWRQGRTRMVAAAVTTAIAIEAPHVAFAGTRILGYIPGYLKEEHYESGGRFLLLGLLPLPGSVLTALAAAVVMAVSVWVLRRRLPYVDGLAVLLAVVILVTTPVQPWYAVTVAGLGVLAGAPWLILLGLAAEPYYAAVILADPHQPAVGRASYALAALGLALGWWWRRRKAAAVLALPSAAPGSEARPLPAAVLRQGSGISSS